MQVQRGAGLVFQLAGSQEVVQVRIGVDDAHHLKAQAQRVEPRRARISSWLPYGSTTMAFLVTRR